MGIEWAVQHTQVGAGSGNLDDDGRLAEGVGELGDGNGRVGSRNSLDLVEQPGGGLGTVGGAVVAVVEARYCQHVLTGWIWAHNHSLGQSLQPGLGVGVRDRRDEGVRLGDVGQSGGVCHSGLEDLLRRGGQDRQDLIVL